MKKAFLVIGTVMAFAVAHQLNGICYHLQTIGFLPHSNEIYQFFDDMGMDLSIFVTCAVIVASTKSRVYIYMGVFMGLFALSDMTGLVFNPNHYDGFAWELGCAGFSGLCILIYHFFTSRKVRHYEWRGAVKVNDKAASPPFQTRATIGFVQGGDKK